MISPLVLTGSIIFKLIVIPATDDRLGGHHAYAPERSRVIYISEEHKDDQELLTHELGHRFDFDYLRGSSRRIAYECQRMAILEDDPSLEFYSLRWDDCYTPKKGMKPVSTYGNQSAVEDFAEYFTLYVRDNRAAKRYRKEYKVMTKLLQDSSLLKP